MGIQEQLEAEFTDYDYLSDGAYIGHTNHRTFVIFTSDGVSILNRIELDGHALRAQGNFVQRMTEKYHG